MAKRLKGKTVLITGASSGIGRATALEFARTCPEDLKIILAARREDKLKELSVDIQHELGDGNGVKVLPVMLDVSEPAQVRGFLSKLPAEFQEPTVLINNAGLVRGIDPVGEIKDEDIKIMVDTNVTGLFHMTQECIRVMHRVGHGDIINIGSIAGRAGYPGGSIYCATKAAVRTFTDALRHELIASKIRVIGIDPGQVETEFSLVRFYGDETKARGVYKGATPLTPQDIAEAIVFAAGRPENVVIADMLIFPNHQASATSMHRTDL